MVPCFSATRASIEYVVAAPPYRAAGNTAMGWKISNLRTEMTRLVRRAGVSGWPRLFHSMRASRQTELQREFPLHIVCSWLGNSPRISQQSYLLVTEDNFAKAAGVAKVVVSPPPFCPKRSILAGLVKFFAVGCGLNDIAPSADSSGP
ncbi:MAG: hypothetical protein NTV29_05965 [Planctomycetota bacterium]|nr:hypothetical protein [Planctomycetota bacterium]